MVSRVVVLVRRLFPERLSQLRGEAPCSTGTKFRHEDTQRPTGEVVDAADEAELLERAQRGDQEAFFVLVEREIGRLRIMCFHILKDWADVEDALQDATLRAWNKILGCNQTFSGWFYKIARHAALDMYRDAYRRRRMPLDVKPDDHEDFTDKMIWGHDLKAVASSLSAEERMIIELHHMRGYPLNAVADVMGKSHEAIRQQWVRMKAKLRRLLGPDYFSPSDQPEGDDDRTHA